MKYVELVLAVLLTGCAQLTNGQIQPVVLKGNNVYYTTCSGAVEDWGSCNRKAQATCSKSYLPIKTFESPVSGHREMTFECKN